MKINFTKKEYRLLVTLMEIANWVMTAHDEQDNPEKEPYQAVRKKILSHYKEMGMGDCYQEKDGEFYETFDYEQAAESTQLIEQYDEDTFWAELIAKLVDRDFYQKHGDNEMDMETKMAEMTRLEEIYVNEINQNGLENLIIAHREPSKLH
jgi:hypothetical protein